MSAHETLDRLVWELVTAKRNLDQARAAGDELAAKLAQEGMDDALDRISAHYQTEGNTADAD